MATDGDHGRLPLRWFDYLNVTGCGFMVVFMLALVTSQAWVLVAFFVGVLTEMFARAADHSSHRPVGGDRASG